MPRIHNLLKLKKYRDRLADEVASRTCSLESANQQVGELRDQLLHSEKLAAIGLLAAVVAHEINNPVGFVNANLGTLKSYVDTSCACCAPTGGVRQRRSILPVAAAAQLRRDLNWTTCATTRRF